MNNLFTLIIVLVFVYFIRKTTKERISVNSLITAFATKIIATIGVWYIYTYYYTDIKLNDIHKYFNDGYLLNQSFKSAPFETLKFILTNKTTPEITELTEKLLFWTKPNQYGLLNDNQTIILVNFLLCFISNDSLLLQSILISIISFYTTIRLLVVLKSYFKLPFKLLFLILFFNPSYLIWTSGNFKETFIYIGLTFLFVNLIILSFKKQSKKHHFLILINLIFIMLCKNYFFLFLLPGIIGFYLQNYISKINYLKPIKFAYVTFFFALIGAALFYNPVNFDNTIKDPIKRKLFIKKLNSKSYNENALGKSRNLIEILRFKQADQLTEAKRQKAKTLIYTPKLDEKFRSFLKCIPFSYFNTLCRPNIIDFKKVELIPDAIFSLFIFFLLFLVLFFRRKIELQNHQQIITLLIYFTTFSFILIGMLVPVLGNLVRYRAPVLPLFTIALLSMIDFNKIPFWNKS